MPPRTGSNLEKGLSVTPERNHAMNKIRHLVLHWVSVLLLLPLIAIPGRAIALGSPASTTNSAAATLTTPITHVFVIVMENHSFNQVWNTASTPYTTALAKAYARASNYYAITHPSLPNYLDLYAGSNYGITNDCSPSSSCHVNAKHLADNLAAKGRTWKFYQESMPGLCTLKGSGTYAPKHNPVIYFDDIRLNSTRCKSHVVYMSNLWADLATAATTPNYAFITPNLCDDTHDCSVGTGDGWLKSHMPSILKSPACTVTKCLVMITWDEDGGGAGNHVLTIFAGSGARTGFVSTAAYNHYSLLRTVEYIFGLPAQTTRDAAAHPMTDMLR
jgi:phospholipase C